MVRIDRGDLRWWLVLLIGPLIVGSGERASAQDAETLRTQYVLLKTELSDSPFGRPLHLRSRDDGDELSGEVHAVIGQPHAVVGPALSGALNWCEILILHLNVKHCLASRGGDALSLSVGRKHDVPLADVYRFEFRYRVVAAAQDYLQVALDAVQGPVGTHDYRIVMEVTALDAQRSFLRLSYAYRYGMVARAGMHSYLATLGRDKVGFSRVPTRDGSEPRYIGGTRGIIERNTMRYYLAVEAYLGSLSLPASARNEQRIRDWHEAVERYPRQLHELERDEYLQMKRREFDRQARLN